MLLDRMMDPTELKYIITTVGDIITVGTELFRYPETLSQPEIIDNDLTKPKSIEGKHVIVITYKPLVEL